MLQLLKVFFTVVAFNIFNYTIRILCFVALIVLDSYLAVYVPKQAKVLLNDTISGSTAILYGVGIYAVLKFCGSTLRYINDLAIFPLLNDLIRIFKFSTCRHIAQLPFTTSQHINPAVTVSRFWRMSLNMHRVFKTFLAQIIPTIVKFWAVFASLHQMNVLGGYGLVLSVISMALMAITIYQYMRVKKQAWKLTDDTNAAAQDYLTNTYWHKYYFTSFSRFLGIWFQREANIWLTQNVWLIMVQIAFELCVLLFSFCILYFTFTHIQKGILTPGDFLLVEGYLIALLIPSRSLFLEIRALIDANIDLTPLVELFKHKKEKRDGTIAPKAQSSLVLDHVSFGYEKDQCVIKDCQLELQPGDRLLIEGENGSGKTTLCHLILGLLPPTTGVITWKDTPAHTVPFDVLSKDIMYISSQHPFLDQTVWMHVSLGQENIQKERIKKALLDVGLAIDVNTNIKDLSQGQKQRVLLAKVLLAHPKVLILDEALSMIDIDGQERILKHFDSMIDIIIMVSHHQQQMALPFTHRILCRPQ